MVVSLTSAENLCKDFDNGPLNPRNPDDYSLGTASKVQYGIKANTKNDACVSSEDRDLAYTLSSSQYLKEYYCTDDDKREFKIYKCADYGFTGCENGACTGKAVLSNKTSKTKTSLCGNKIVDEGEDCDPPFSICFGKDTTEYGQCNTKCKCELAQVEHTKCGNNIIDEGEDCESDNDCEEFEHCKSCICVPKPISEIQTKENKTAEKTETVETQKTKKEKAEEKEEQKKEEDKYPVPEIHPPNVTVKNFSKLPGITVTKKTTNLFVKIWNWIISLFS